MIRAKRRSLGLSQAALGQALGLTFQQVQKYERGANRISTSKLYEIAQRLDTPLWWFFDGLDLPDGSSLTSEIVSFLQEDGSHDLVLAYGAMDPAVRKALVALAKAMVDVDKAPQTC
jgi:transcriptional regulator with XRE-family HTH domain